MRVAIVLLAVTLALFSAPLYSAPADAAEVVGSDIFAQTFQVKMHNGQVETVPFSKWTDFFKVSSESRLTPKVAIDPTEIQTGDRVLIVLDSNDATALSIVVMPRPKRSDAVAMLR
jgi:hypothetical protein